MDDKEDISGTNEYSLDAIKAEFLKSAPSFAREDASIAIGTITEMQNKGRLRNGLYYIVLVDLIGSTKYSAEYGNDRMSKRVIAFVDESVKALKDPDIRNTGIFLKDIGDAALFIFQHFPDIIKWRTNFQNHLDKLFEDGDP